MAFTLQHGHSHGGMSHAHSHSAGHSNGQSSGHSSGRGRNNDSENDGVDNEAAQEYAAISNRNDDASPIANGHAKTENAETKSRKVAGNVTSRTLQFRKNSDEYPSTDSLHIDINSVENHDLKKSQEPNINVRAAFIHVIGDLIQSVGILIAAFIIYFKVRILVQDTIYRRLRIGIFIYPVVCHRQNLDNPYMCYVFRTPLLPPPPWPIHSWFWRPKQSDPSVTSTLQSVNRWRHNEYSCCSHPSFSYPLHTHLLSRSDW